MKSALECTGVSVKYSASSKHALNNIDINLAPGERAALLGLNGSGKTTLLYAVAGLLPFEGSITVCDIPLSRDTINNIRDKIGFLFSAPGDQIFFPNVLDDITFTVERRGASKQEALAKAASVMKGLGIEHLAARSPHRLSHGQTQRVALAGALIGTPPLLLLDEPSAALDPIGKKSLSQILSSLDAAFLIATHDIEFACSVCQRFIILSDGTITMDTHDPDAIKHYWEKQSENKLNLQA